MGGDRNETVSPNSAMDSMLAVMKTTSDNITTNLELATQKQQAEIVLSLAQAYSLIARENH